MKRIYTMIVVLGTICLVALHYSCRKDNTDLGTTELADPNAAMSKEQAESYYYNKLMKQPDNITNGLQTLGVKTTSGKRNWKYLIFNKGYTSETKNVTFIEMPLLYNQRPSSVISTDAGPGEYSAKVKILNTTFDRILIYKNKTTGLIDQSIVTYIPDADYLKRHNNDISGNQINKLDTDYNGYIEYKKWDGSNMFLLKIVNGKTVKDYVYKKDPAPTNQVQLNSMVRVNSIVCTPMYTQHWLQQCYSDDPEGTNMVCQDWVLLGTDYWDDCHEDGTGPPLTGDPCVDYGWCGPPTPPAGEIPPPPPPPVPDPCQTAKNLQSNTTFKSGMNDLKGKVNLNYEAGYVKTIGSATPEYRTGTPNTLSWDTPQLSTIIDHSLEYVEHNHYAGAGSLSIFSNGDIDTYYQYLHAGKAANNNQFAFSVTTSQGTSYTLVLNDQTQFNTFYTTYLSDATGKSIFASMFNGYVSATNTTSANEDGFLKMINVLHMGVSVLKANSDHSDWNKISWDNASATKVTSDCGN